MALCLAVLAQLEPQGATLNPNARSTWRCRLSSKLNATWVFVALLSIFLNNALKNKSMKKHALKTYFDTLRLQHFLSEAQGSWPKWPGTSEPSHFLCPLCAVWETVWREALIWFSLLEQSGTQDEITNRRIAVINVRIPLSRPWDPSSSQIVGHLEPQAMKELAKS